MNTRTQELANEVQQLTTANTNLMQQLNALQQQMQQLIAQQQPMQQQPQPNQTILDAHQRAQANNGIAGYENERALTIEEQSYITQMLGLGINVAAAHELFRHGYNENKKWKKIKPDGMSHLVTNVSKNKSPYCLDTNKAFYGHSFGDKIATLVNWIHHQESVGAPSTSTAWVANPGAEEQTEQRMEYLDEKKSNKNTDDVPVPSSLKSMKDIAAFEEELLAYLSNKRGKTGVPLSYVLRTESAVPATARAGTVGVATTDTYRTWDAYLEKCTVHEGDHWVTDNTAVYTILASLIRNGPGWHYIQAKSRDTSNGRALWERLIAKAYDVSNVDRICDECRKFHATARFDGLGRNNNFETYVRSWYTNNKILERHGRLPPQRDLVSDFISSIHMENSVAFQSVILKVKSTRSLRENFDLAIDEFKLAIGNSTPSNKRKLGALSGGNNNNGTSEGNTGNGKDYGKEKKNWIPHKEWKLMSSKQKSAYNKARDSRQPNFKKQRMAAMVKHVISALQNDGQKQEKTEPPQDNAGDQFGAQAHGGGSSGKQRRGK